MSKELHLKLAELVELAKNELPTNTTTVTIIITATGLEFKTQERTAETLKRDGISMRNIQGEFIK